MALIIYDFGTCAKRITPGRAPTESDSGERRQSANINSGAVENGSVKGA
jgi:hypothetical protein